MKYTSTTSYNSLIFCLLIILSCIVSAEKPQINHSVTNDTQESIPSIYTSLYDAIKTDRAYEVKKFIEFGADINHRYEGAKTPLMLASSIGSIGVVKVLLELGADHSLISEENMTAMDYAIKSNNKFIIAVLETGLNTSSSEKSLVTQNLNSVDTNDKTENSNASLKPKGSSLPIITNNRISSAEPRQIHGYLDIEGTYNAKTTATFSKCGAYNQTIEYFAEESISKISKSGRFVISYTAPLLNCKGKGKFTDDNQNIKGKYNCTYETTNGLRGTLLMKFYGYINENIIDMNYRGHDTTPGIQCNYYWKRKIVFNDEEL